MAEARLYHKRLIVTTAGTSLLSNQIHRANEPDWGKRLTDMAHQKKDELSSESEQILNTLKNRAVDAINTANNQELRKFSAELNALVSLYEEQFLNYSNSKNDYHIIISSDTAPGRTTSEILKQFLDKNGFITDCPSIAGLDALDSLTYRKGVYGLIDYFDNQLPNYKEAGYQIIFNLSGGFKSLAGYLTSLGMLYANETVFIFEGSSSKLIRIPQAPVNLNEDLAAQHFGSLAILAKERYLPPDSLPNIPESFIERDSDLSMISVWGKILWNRVNKNPKFDSIFTDTLFEYPKIEYTATFKKDWNKLDSTVKIEIQKAVISASALLIESGNDVSALKRNGGLLYSNFEQKPEVGHFRASRQWRITCTADSNGLKLRHCGSHDYTEQSENV